MQIEFAWNVKSYFLGKRKKNIVNLLFAEFAQRVVKVDQHSGILKF